MMNSFIVYCFDCYLLSLSVRPSGQLISYNTFWLNWTYSYCLLYCVRLAWAVTVRCLHWGLVELWYHVKGCLLSPTVNWSQQQMQAKSSTNTFFTLFLLIHSLDCFVLSHKLELFCRFFICQTSKNTYVVLLLCFLVSCMLLWTYGVCFSVNVQILQHPILV